MTPAKIDYKFHSTFNIVKQNIQFQKLRLRLCKNINFWMIKFDSHLRTWKSLSFQKSFFKCFKVLNNFDFFFFNLFGKISFLKCMSSKCVRDKIIFVLKYFQLITGDLQIRVIEYICSVYILILWFNYFSSTTNHHKTKPGQFKDSKEWLSEYFRERGFPGPQSGTCI